MSIQLVVRAEVFDIAQDSLCANDAFFVDTNVLYWLSYSRASLPNPTKNKVRKYEAYVKKARTARVKLFQCGLSLSELAHLIEKTEREIYEKSNGVSVTPKEFRHNYPSERNRVVVEIQSSWGVATNLAPHSLDIIVDGKMTRAALSRLMTQPLDGYDLFYLEAMKAARIMQVISDDGDFASVPGIQLFTANPTVMKTAQAQGKLSQR